MPNALRYIFLLLLSLLGELVYAQKEANIWYFGKFLGLDFNSGTAVPLNNGLLNTLEGVATISNTNGNLLFYTDGVVIRNKVHLIMPNGSGLFGNPSSTQSAIIVPKIGDSIRYYVFTVDALLGTRGINYSVVNMTLDNGNGDVELKNVPINNNSVEKITAVKHCNNRDIWVIAHDTASNGYYSYLVSSLGVNTTAIMSYTGTVLPGVIPPASFDTSWLGYLKASPNGKKIAASHSTVNLDISDFDNATGLISNSISLFQPGDPDYFNYGVEFSPDSKLLYATVFYKENVTNFTKNAIFQYDISLGSAAAIRASRQIIASSNDVLQVFAALQIAPDGKIYMSKNIYKDLASINNPNVYGAGCNYVSKAITFTLPSQVCTYGLPTFIQSYFYPQDSFNYVANCKSLTTNFSYPPAANVVSVLWNFNDPASGANNTSTSYNPVHTFSAPGTYNTMLIKFTNCGTDTLRKLVNVDTLDINLGADTTICSGNSYLLNAAAVGSTNTFLWQDSSTNPTYMATTNGLYWVEENNNNGCTSRDSINITFKTLPVFNLGTDSSLCSGDTLLLNATVQGANSYLWNTGATSSTIKAWLAGTYWCKIDNGCFFTDSLTILSIKPSPVVNLGNDQAICEGLTTDLNATYLTSSYLWQDGSTNPIYTVNKQGLYFVQVNYNGCINSDSIFVNYNLKPVFTLGPDQYICQGIPITLSPVLNPFWQLKWQDGSTNSTYTVTKPGLYSLTATNNCGSTLNDVDILQGVCKVFMPSAFTPNGDSKNDIYKALGTETVTQFNMKIYNRYGEIVFETNNKLNGWNGNLKGQPSPVGSFVYVVTYTDISSPESIKLKGSFTLIR